MSNSVPPLRRSLLLWKTLGWLMLVPLSASGVELLAPDDFEDGTTQGWRSGSANNPNPPSWEPSGGPDGPGDGYLRVQSSGLSGPGGNLVAFNTEQWAGDYAAAGVVAIRAQLRNLGESDLVIRLLIEGSGGSVLSAAAANLPAHGTWRQVVWPTPGIGGVVKLRILHAPDAGDFEPLAGTLGVDDVTALTGDVCRDAELRRSQRALCRVYCERLDCDGAPRNGRACESIASRFERRDGAPPPCALDADGDGWRDALDNCPEVADAELADRDGDGVGDVCDNCPDTPNPAGLNVCDCPCFGRAEIAALIETLSDPTTYVDLACLDERPNVKPLTYVGAFRRDGLRCGSASQDCSALAAEFTEDNACQINPPAPEAQVLLGEISDRQREACRARILAEAEAAGLVCR